MPSNWSCFSVGALVVITCVWHCQTPSVAACLTSKACFSLSRATESLAPGQRLLPAFRWRLRSWTHKEQLQRLTPHVWSLATVMHAAPIQAKLQRRFHSGFCPGTLLPVTCWPSWDCDCCVFGENCLAEKSQSCNSPREIPNCFCDKWLLQWTQLLPFEVPVMTSLHGLSFFLS